MYQNVLLYLN